MALADLRGTTGARSAARRSVSTAATRLGGFAALLALWQAVAVLGVLERLPVPF